MLVARLLRQKVTAFIVNQNGPPDEMGDPTETEITRTFRGYAWQTNSTDETANTNIQEQQWRLVIDKRSVGKIAGVDRINVEGILDLDGTPLDFEIDGPPWPALNPRTNRYEFVEARLKKAG